MQRPGRRTSIRRSAIVLTVCIALVSMTACARITSGTAGPAPVPVIPVVTTSPASTPTSGSSPLPASVWIDAATVPLHDSQHWPELAGLAKPFYGEAFAVQALCNVAPTVDQFSGAAGGWARVEHPPGGWSLQQQIVHFPGDPWQAGQVAAAAYTKLVDALTNCGVTQPDAQVTVTVPNGHCDTVIGGCSQTAATVEVPSQGIVGHVYLSAPGSSVAELSVWSSPTPEPPWPSVDDAGVLAAMNAPLCTAWPC